MADSRKRVHLIIKGRVQGVGYRYFVFRIATELSLTGIVQNLADGTVEVIAEGGSYALEKLIQTCHEGPSMSLVRDVFISWSEWTGEFNDFQITY